MRQTARKTKGKRAQSPLTLVELRNSKIAKYDIAMKQLLSLRSGRLREILGVPAGTFLREEFPGFEFRRADALIHYDGELHHIEFQTANDKTIPARMHEYAYLINKYKDQFGDFEVKSISQTVVYLGLDGNSMLSPYTHWGTTHQFSSISLHQKFSRELVDELIRGHDPFGWIIALLLLPSTEFKKEYIFQLARKLNQQVHGPKIADAKFLLLIAALLRKLTQEELDEVEKMLRIDIRDSTFLRHVYDAGYNDKTATMILERIDFVLSENEIVLSDVQRESISGFEPERLLSVLVAASARDVETLMEIVPAPPGGLSLSPDVG